jgi:hypothetical protein
MNKLFALATLLAVTAAILTACGADPNANLANTVGIGNVNINAANMPPGFSNAPLPLNGVNGTPTPGIPADPTNVARPGTTPIPGIDPKNVNVKPRAGATATPGIPSEAEIRRQLQGSSNASTGTDAPSMRSTAPSMRSSNTNGPRTGRKP